MRRLAVTAATATLALAYWLHRRRRMAVTSERERAHTTNDTSGTNTLAMLDDRGFVVLQSAAKPAQVARMRKAIQAEADKAEAGGYLIWTPAEALPTACREWAESDAAALLQRSLAPGTPAVRLLGGAALWKRAGVHDGTPFHQDFAYAESEEPGSTASREKRHAAVWLALTPTGPRSSCLRFAPSLGYELLPHRTLPRAEAPSGFETHMVGLAVERAQAAAEDVVLEPGQAVIIGDRVVHGSHGGKTAESDRLAFSPLFEVDCTSH